jgi:hypothetical protein
MGLSHERRVYPRPASMAGARRRVSVTRSQRSGTLHAMLWAGGDDPQLKASKIFETVADLRRWLVGLGRGVAVVWTAELLADRSLAITVAVATGMPLPE